MRVVAALLALVLTSCSKPPVPICEKYTVYYVETSNGAYFLLDVENLKRLAALVRGLSEGTCKLDEEEKGAVNTQT